MKEFEKIVESNATGTQSLRLSLIDLNDPTYAVTTHNFTGIRIVETTESFSLTHANYFKLYYNEMRLIEK
jgi:hypothetical protein